MSLFPSDFPVYDESPSHEKVTLGPSCEGLMELMCAGYHQPRV